MTLRPQQLLTALEELAALAGPRRYLVGFSGGCDSTVLLDLLRRALPRVSGASLLALHLDHGWHADSRRWAEACLGLAHRFGVRCEILDIDAQAAAGQSPEAAARSARYAALAQALGEGDVLVTAHHADDQLETVLLQLARGAGPAGLAAMPALTPFASGWHWRPLLAATRAQIEAYAAAAGIEPIADPANADARYDRSYLRLQVTPALRARWPAIAQAVGRSARHCATAVELLEEIAAQDLAAVGEGEAHLDARRLGGLSRARQANVLRYWIAARGLAVPSTAQLERCLTDVLGARPDAEPCVRWPGVELRRYRQRIYAIAALDPVPEGWRARFDPAGELQLPGGLGTLASAPGTGAGIAREHLVAEFEVRFRRGGETLRPTGSEHTRTLRNLYQEHGVVPWMRGRIPLLYARDELVAVGDLWVSRAFAARRGRPGAAIVWRGHPPLY